LGNVCVPVQGVIFDCDGTLMDTMGLWVGIEREFGRRVGHVFSKAEEDVLRSLTISETGEYLHGTFGILDSPQAVVGEIERLAQDFYATKSQLKPGALRFLQALHQDGIPCAIASSSPHSLLDPGVRHTGIADYLLAVVSTDDVGASKRQSAVYDRARQLMGSDLDATWVFEDGAYTFATTVPAGYGTVGVYDSDDSGTFGQLAKLADVAIRSYDELDVDCFLAGGYRRAR
jgi:beta-phosphoglucomutase-like phosphatase (HAD superfamily)